MGEYEMVPVLIHKKQKLNSERTKSKMCSLEELH